MAHYNPAFTPDERRKVLDRAANSHPLEMFPWFRRWPQSHGRDLLYTFIWNCLFGLLFTLFGIIGNWRMPSANFFWINFVVSNCVGYTLHALFLLGGCTIESRIREAGRVVVTAYYMAMSTVGVLGGFWLSTLVLGRRFMPSLGDPRWIMAIAVSSLVISIVIAIIYFWREKTALTEAALEREQRRAAEIERVALAANLRALQAQIEPHFLFNTLANLSVLIGSDPERAERLLADLIAYLRATLQRTREAEPTLGDEIELLRRYLDILGLRLGPRLRVAFDVPPELLARPFPLLMLQPLVENAITHGIEPQVGGGELRIAARQERGRLQLTVSDTGVGLREGGSGTGFGLENVRGRLHALFGEAARLDVRSNAGRGVVATVEIPA